MSAITEQIREHRLAHCAIHASLGAALIALEDAEREAATEGGAALAHEAMQDACLGLEKAADDLAALITAAAVTAQLLAPAGQDPTAA